MKKALGTLNAFLATRTFLVLHRITLADIVAFCNLYIGFTKVCSRPSPTNSLTNVRPSIHPSIHPFIVFGGIEQGIFPRHLPSQGLSGAVSIR